MIVQPSPHDHPATMRRLTESVQARGLTIFARIDHAAAAREVGLELPDEQVLVFGNPTAGTMLMQDDPRIGIELPLRMLVWTDDQGVAVGYEDPRELVDRFAVSAHAATLDAMAQLLAALADAVCASPMP